MSSDEKPNIQGDIRMGQSGGISISGSGSSIGFDVVGRDKITVQSARGASDAELEVLAKQFAQIKQKIEARPPNPEVEKDELRDTVKKIEEEVMKWDQANPAKVMRWLTFLSGLAPDIFMVAVAILADPAVGIAKPVQLAAQKAKESLRP